MILPHHTDVGPTISHVAATTTTHAVAPIPNQNGEILPPIATRDFQYHTDRARFRPRRDAPSLGRCKTAPSFHLLRRCRRVIVVIRSLVPFARLVEAEIPQSELFVCCCCSCLASRVVSCPPLDFVRPRGLSRHSRNQYDSLRESTWTLFLVHGRNVGSRQGESLYTYRLAMANRQHSLWVVTLHCVKDIPPNQSMKEQQRIAAFHVPNNESKNNN
eukprot:scaffold6066_cov161-Amphora_coffeaeformis.AAC.5